MRSETSHKITINRYITIVRHGKAAPKDIGLEDFERTLTEEGIKECELVIARVRKKKLKIDHMISSPADRAHETAFLFARRFDYPFSQIQICDTLYSSGSIGSAIGMLKGLPDSIQAAAIFGHNPLLDQLAAQFVSGFSETIPKSGVVAITFNVKSWKELKTGAGKLLFFVSP